MLTQFKASCLRKTSKIITLSPYRTKRAAYTGVSVNPSLSNSHSTRDSSPSMSCTSIPLSWSTVGSLWLPSTSLFPPKHSLPRKCLYSLRVWLRHQNVDQRIFADDALWVGTDPDFSVIPDAVLATVWHKAPDRQFYKCLVGRAEVNFILRWVLTRLISFAQSRLLTNSATWCSWEWLKESVYSLTFEYEAGGVGKALLENMIVRLDFPPQKLSCHIYTIPLVTKPVGATHRVRVWLKTPSPYNTEEDPDRSHTYQRIWSTDEFRVGGYLDFSDIDPRRVILAAPVERPPLRVRTTESFAPGLSER